MRRTDSAHAGRVGISNGQSAGNHMNTVKTIVLASMMAFAPSAWAQTANCKANDAMAARLRAMGATGIQIEGCVDAKPAAPAGLQLAPPDMSKPLPQGGESPEQFTAGLRALAVGNFAAAARAYHAGAELGDPGCALNLAMMYEYGQAVPKDRKLAQAWLEKSIEDGRLLDQRAMRYNFTGFLDLAERGYAAGQFAAGRAYAEKNDGAKPTGSLERARLWLGKAAAQGNASAATLLKEMDAPTQTAASSQGGWKYEESDYLKKAAAARKSQNAANCERASKGARVYCQR